MAKITIDDLIKNTESVIEKKDQYKENLATMTKEEIDKFVEYKNKKSKQRNTKRKSDFYDVVPRSALEMSINKVLCKKTEDHNERKARITFQQKFDAKMRRIKRIKSKSYRKYKRQVTRELPIEEYLEDSVSDAQTDKSVEELDSEEATDSNNIKPSMLEKIMNGDLLKEQKDGPSPIFEFKGSDKVEENRDAIDSAFNAETYEDDNLVDFIEEKKEIVEQDRPQVIETVLPGWGDWAGPGLEIVKTKYNTIVEKRDGIAYSERKDYDKGHIIINENVPEFSEKYRAELPFGYTSDDYDRKINIPTSKECSTLRIIKKQTNTSYVKKGEAIEPFTYELEE